MQTLRPTVKRNISLFSVQAWQQGYGKYFQESFGWYYPIYFHYDAEKVNFYHTLDDFSYFKQTITPRLIKDELLFEKLGGQFKKDVSFLRTTTLSEVTLPEIFEAMGRIMSLYIFIVSDDFVKQVPLAWELRLLSEGILYEKDEQIEKYLSNFLETQGIDKDLAHFLTLAEVASLQKGEQLSLEMIRSRTKEYIIENTNLITGKNFETFCREHDFSNPEQATTADQAQEIRGQVSYPGKVEGRVKIVKNLSDAQGITEDSVVVCIMSNATYTPAIARGRALVTDEGGITCHAAIVARELKKPCITGTKVATKLLKDGDLVEVDGEKGIVRML